MRAWILFVKKRFSNGMAKAAGAATRIPGLIVSDNGILLAYYETRLDSGDWNARNIGLRRSLDGGRTWTAGGI